MALPPHITAEDRVVLFDGVCKLCNGWTQFLIRHDRHGRFKLCSVQSPEGQDILAWLGMPTDTFSTMLLIEGPRAHTQSDAVLNVLRQLPKPWCFLAVLKLLPKVLRDWVYDRVALNRYRLFGRYDQCSLPTQENLEKFLGHGQRSAGSLPKNDV